MRVLMLSSMFPKPHRMQVGAWSKMRAEALIQNGAAVSVVSPVSWFPLPIGPMREWAQCPAVAKWLGGDIFYPNWLKYEFSIFRRLAWRSPSRQNAIAWRSMRRRLLKIANETHCDVIWATNSTSSGEMARRLSQLTGIPYVISEHDNEEVAACIEHPRRAHFCSTIWQEASAVITTSRQMQRIVSKVCPSARVQTIHNGVNAIPADVLSTPRPEHLAGKKIVLCVAGFYPRKGVPLLVEAFARATASMPDALLRIIGDGDERAAVEQAIARFGMQGKVQLLGGKPHSEVLQEMAWADVFALISWAEAFGNVYLEAMAAGTPVVCTTDCGAAEVVTSGKQGLVVEPHNVEAAANAIRELLQSEQLREQMGVEGQALAQSLSWKSHGAQFVQLLNRLARPVQPNVPIRASLAL